MIEIQHLDDVHCKVLCEPSTAQELADYFTFEVPGARFMPAVRNKMWDGKIRLFNPVTRTIYAGLTNHIVQFCEGRDYDFFLDKKFVSSTNFSNSDVDDLAECIGLPFEARDYQKSAITTCVNNKRQLLLSPTGSGKSLIIYMLTQHYAGHRVLVLVPIVSLVHQMKKDFADYGCTENVTGITGGVDKNDLNRITVSTWQSIYKMPRKWFSQFDVVIGDEAHLFKAKSLVNIMTKMTDCPFRFGFTGTLDGTVTHRLVLEGLFGPVEKVTTTTELMENKVLADLNINVLVLKHSDYNKQQLARADYRKETEYIVGNKSRNEFIVKLLSSLKGNTLLLFSYVDKHGKPLYDMCQSLDKEVHLVYGGVSGDDRENIRNYVEKNNNNVILASYGTFSTGINIRNLDNIVFASPSKSKIRVLQSIGRGLRTNDNKVSARLFDIVDDLRWKGWTNYTMTHYAERVKIYNEENFKYEIHGPFNLKE